MNVEKIKQALNRIWTFIKKYWFILVTAASTFIGYLFGRNRSTADFNSLREQLQQYKQQLQFTQSELQSLRGIKSEADDRISELEIQLQQSRESVRRIEEQLSDDGTIIQQSSDILKSTERDIRKLREAIRQLREFLQVNEKPIDGL